MAEEEEEEEVAGDQNSRRRSMAAWAAMENRDIRIWHLVTESGY
jgi:hypothetical protein